VVHREVPLQGTYSLKVVEVIVCLRTSYQARTGGLSVRLPREGGGARGIGTALENEPEEYTC